MESNTPRTDALIADRAKLHGLASAYVSVIDHARQLETELAAEIKNKKEFERDWLEACDQIATQATRIAELERERNEAKEAADAYSKGVYSETMLRAAKAIGDNTHLTLALSQAKDALKDGLNYIKHVGANHVMRGEPHPQQWLVEKMEQALSTPERA